MPRMTLDPFGVSHVGFSVQTFLRRLAPSPRLRRLSVHKCAVRPKRSRRDVFCRFSPTPPPAPAPAGVAASWSSSGTGCGLGPRRRAAAAQQVWERAAGIFPRRDGSLAARRYGAKEVDPAAPGKRSAQRVLAGARRRKRGCRLPPQKRHEVNTQAPTVGFMALRAPNCRSKSIPPKRMRRSTNGNPPASSLIFRSSSIPPPFKRFHAHFCTPKWKESLEQAQLPPFRGSSFRIQEGSKKHLWLGGAESQSEKMQAIN